MRYIIILIFTFYYSCNKKNISNQKSELINKFPIGNKFLLNKSLEKNIEYKYNDDGDVIFPKKNSLDSISVLFSNIYDSLEINNKKRFTYLPQIQKKIIYNKMDKNGMIHYLDSCYFTKLIFKNDKLQLKLYKSGFKYQKYLGFENTSITSYLILASYDLQNNLIEYKPIYYNESFLYLNLSKYFYLDKELNLYLKEYKTDEQGIYLLKEEQFKISSEGKFLKIK